MMVAASNNGLQIERLQLGPFGTNAYILVCPETKESAIIDAPAEADKIIARLKDTTPKDILLTHSHVDLSLIHISEPTRLRRSRMPSSA